MSGTINLVVARTLVSALVRNGVTQFFLSPGARSMPLAVALLSNEAVRVYLVVDERCAGFAALGMARVVRQPVALVCTSGSALAHYLPALMEADASFVPLLVVSADRPWSLQGCGANQTAFQQGFFGRMVRACFEVDGAGDGHLAQVARVGAQAVGASLWPLPGPVHLNVRFEKPLLPASPGDAGEAAPGPVLVSGVPKIVADGVTALAALLAKQPLRVISVGPHSAALPVAPLARALEKLSGRTGATVVAETASGLLGNLNNLVNAEWAYRYLAPATDGERGGVVLEINGPPTSSVYSDFFDRFGLTRVSLSPFSVREPFGGAALLMRGDPAATVEALLETGQELRTMGTGLPVAPLVPLASRINDFLTAEPFCEAHVVKRVARALGRDDTLLLGNSLVVRDFDLTVQQLAARVLHQRGLSGIDGLVSATFGMAMASGGRAVTVVGDMAAWHDMGGFSLLAKGTSNATVVIVHNGGGRIFEQVSPVGSAPYDDLRSVGFVLKDDRRFSFVSGLGLDYRRVDNLTGLEEALNAMGRGDRPLVIEAVVDGASDGWRSRLGAVLRGAVSDTREDGQ